MALAVRLHVEQLGSHTHVHAYARQAPTTAAAEAEVMADVKYSAMGSVGHLTFRNEEWRDLNYALTSLIGMLHRFGVVLRIMD